MRTRTYLSTESKFVVNEEKKVVLCILECQLNTDKLRHNGVYKYDVTKNCGKTTCFTVKAVAKCSPDDTFSEEIGKRLAESKAKRMAFKKANVFYKKALSYYSKVVGFLENTINNCNIASEKENKRIINEEYLK